MQAQLPHNLTEVIQSQVELGIEATFWKEEAPAIAPPAAPLVIEAVVEPVKPVIEAPAVEVPAACEPALPARKGQQLLFAFAGA